MCQILFIYKSLTIFTQKYNNKGICLTHAEHFIISRQGQHFSRMPASCNSVKCLQREPESHVKIGREGRFEFLEEEAWL